MVNKDLKEILKILNVLYVRNRDNKCNKALNILNFFFHKTLEAYTTHEAFKIYSKSRPEVIITDIELPNNDGINFIKEIRKTNKMIPIIILTSLKNEEYLFEAIKLNLIDYLLYPINISKFIDAINRTASNIAHDGQKEIIFKNNKKYNYIFKEVVDINNEKIPLTKNEFRLLEFLIENKDRKISKEEIEEYLWADEYITESAFKSLFCRLRNKIGKELVVNTFGVGYSIKIT